MVKEKILKIMLVIMIGITLIGMTTNVFALTDDDLFLDLQNTVDTNTNTNSNTNTNTNTNTDLNTNINTSLNTDTNTNTTSNYNTNLPHAGVAENTMLGVGITLLVILAIYAYQKVKYYKDI